MNTIIDRAREQARELYGNIPCNYKIATRNGYWYESTTSIKILNLDEGQCCSFISKEKNTPVLIAIDSIETVCIIPGINLS